MYTSAGIHIYCTYQTKVEHGRDTSLKKQKPKLSTSSPGNGHLRLWPLRPGAAPPEAPKIWGTGAYSTMLFQAR